MLNVAVLGATGLVGQRFVQLLSEHRWFRLAAVAASPRSVGRRYAEAASWRVGAPLPEEVAGMEVVPADPGVMGDVDVVFSALPAAVADRVEVEFARAGFVVLSNASAHRMDPDVPILNPEVNPDHVALIDEQRRKRGWDGAIVTNPNCTTAILTLSLKPLQDAFGIRRVIVSTMQALSGAGYPGVASLDIVDNVIPFIAKEEEKVQAEALKVLGTPEGPATLRVSASCHRVSTVDGHLEAVFVELEQPADPADAARAMEGFVGEPQRLGLPTAPARPVIVRREPDRPQPRLDRMAGRGMSVVVGRIREDPVVGGVKYVVLGHNTIRGAAGCSVLGAELLRARGYV